MTARSRSSMEETNRQNKYIDPKSGYCSDTKTYHSHKPPVPLPSLSQPLSITEYTLQLLHSTASTPPYTTTPSTPFLIDSATGDRITYSSFFSQVHSLSLSILSHFPSLAKNDVAFILSPPSFHVPVLYFSLLSLGITVSPANPLSSPSELAHSIRLTKPAVAFTTSSIAAKLPVNQIPFGAILMDTPEFTSMIDKHKNNSNPDKFITPTIHQNDTAAILYSSGTTGRVKGVEITHRNLIAVIAELFYSKYVKEAGEEDPPEPHPVLLLPIPLFHVFGFFMLITAASMGETLVLMERFDFEKMLETVEKYKVTYMPVSPPLVVALAKSELVSKYDLSSLKLIGCGGAPLGKEVSERFAARFPQVEVTQGYGMTETGGVATRMNEPEEFSRFGSAGRLCSNLEAKIVNPDSQEALPPGHRGELWLRGPIVMKGYIGDPDATAQTLDREGWLKTGDLCYFDSDGFIYIVDRLKELIKYKAYQVPPAELEHILQSIPDVVDAAVIPYPDEEAGQIPMAYVVRKPGSNITEAQIMDIVAKQVAPYKKIRRVAFSSSIPKSPAGKILRRELVNHATSLTSSKL